jgi:Flp pilus assembly pilin Flp
MLKLYTQYKTIVADLKEKLNENQGQTMVEYVMLIVLVALAVFIASPSVTSAILGVFTRTSSALAPAS